MTQAFRDGHTQTWLIGQSYKRVNDQLGRKRAL
jgi:hypothetical protein